MEAFLSRTYFNVAHPAGYSGVKKLRQAAQDAGFKDASYGKVRAWLHRQDTYALTRPAIRKFKRSRVVQAGLNLQWTMDLADLSKIRDENDDYAYILAVMDQFSRQLYTRPLRAKKPELVVQALVDIIETSGNQPKTLLSDPGGEFRARKVTAFCDKYGIKQFFTSNETKSSSIERLLRTVKAKLFRHMMEHQHNRWVDILVKATQAYNLTPHSSINMAPNDVTVQNQELVRFYQAQARIRRYRSQVAGGRKQAAHSQTAGDSKGSASTSSKPGSKVASIPRPRRRPKSLYKVGDLVRITRLKHIFAKDYDHNYTMELFSIQAVLYRDGVPVYRLKSAFDDEVLEGLFYAQELLRAYKPADDMYKVGSILKTRGSRAYVDWLHYPPKYRSWVSLSSIKDLPGVQERLKAKKSKDIHALHKVKAPSNTVDQRVTRARATIPPSSTRVTRARATNPPSSTRVLRSSGRALKQ